MKQPYFISIRQATSEDRINIVGLQCRALSVLASKDYSPRQIKALLRSKSKPRLACETIFVAEIAGSVIGFAALLGDNTISAVFIEPNFARQGVGSLLLKHLEREVRDRQIPVLWVSSSLTGQSFYRANGYQEVEKINLILGSNYIPCIRMKKRLLPINIKEIRSELIQLVVAMVLICFAIAFFAALTEILMLCGRRLWYYVHGIG